MIKEIKRSDQACLPARQACLPARQGFTLIELMTVMAIIAILATAIIMSLSSHKKRAEGTKALTELSGVMQNIYLCIADEGIVNAPASNGNICSGLGAADTSYGSWPDLSSGALVNFNYNRYGDFASTSWGYSATSTDGTVVCCNSTSGRCENLDPADPVPCSATKVLK